MRKTKIEIRKQIPSDRVEPLVTALGMTITLTLLHFEFCIGGWDDAGRDARAL